MRRSPRLDHSQEAEKELAVAALLACTAEVRQPTFGVAREEHVRLPHTKHTHNTATPRMTHTQTNTASKILDPDTEERPIRRSQSPSNKHTASKTLDPDTEARPIGC